MIRFEEKFDRYRDFIQNCLAIFEFVFLFVAGYVGFRILGWIYNYTHVLVCVVVGVLLLGLCSISLVISKAIFCGYLLRWLPDWDRPMQS